MHLFAFAMFYFNFINKSNQHFIHVSGFCVEIFTEMVRIHKNGLFINSLLNTVHFFCTYTHTHRPSHSSLVKTVCVGFLDCNVKEYSFNSPVPCSIWPASQLTRLKDLVWRLRLKIKQPELVICNIWTVCLTETVRRVHSKVIIAINVSGAQPALLDVFIQSVLP